MDSAIGPCGRPRYVGRRRFGGSGERIGLREAALRNPDGFGRPAAFRSGRELLERS
jgi:hypothetical protein